MLIWTLLGYLTWVALQFAFSEPDCIEIQVTKHIDDGGPIFRGWKKWNWASSGDIFLDGSYFTGSGYNAVQVDMYSEAYSTSPRPAFLVPAMTKNAGPLILH